MKKNKIRRNTAIVCLLLSCLHTAAKAEDNSEIEAAFANVYNPALTLQSKETRQQNKILTTWKLIEQLSAGDSKSKYVAAWSLRFADFQDFNISQAIMEKAMQQASPQATKDPQTRRNMLLLLGDASANLLVGEKKNGNMIPDSVKKTMDRARTALIGALKNDPAAEPAEGAVWALNTIARFGDKKASQALDGYINDKRPGVRYATRIGCLQLRKSDCPDKAVDLTDAKYLPTFSLKPEQINFPDAAQPGTDYSAYTAAASPANEDNFLAQLNGIQAKAKNLAANTKGQGYPYITTSVNGWGFAVDVREMIDGAGTGKNYIPGSQASWQKGFAFPGGNDGYGGVKAGWHAFILGFDYAKEVDLLKVKPHNLENMPGVLRILVQENGVWKSVFETEQNLQCRKMTDKPDCTALFTFPAVKANEVRFEFSDNAEAKADTVKYSHAWFDTLEISKE